MNKRKLCIALGSGLIFLSVVSGAMASIAWFTVTNGFGVGITGSFVEEWFHTGDGTSAHPFVITRPIHYYHLVEFFQRKTQLPGNQRFGTDYLYFQVGYDIDNDGDLEVYDYDNQGIYTGTVDSPSYSKTLNMAYYSGTNSLMPIGTNEIPFIGSFDGKASEGIVISNLNICCSETVEIDGTPVTRTASDIGVFGYVSDADANSNPTVIMNTMIDGLTIDLSDVTDNVASSATGVSHVEEHDDEAYVGYIAGHVHSYVNHQDEGEDTPESNAKPLYDVYVDHATIKGGAGVSSNYGYIGLIDTVDGGQTTTVAAEVEELGNGTGGGGAQGDDWGGSINFQEFNMRFYNNRSSFSYSTNKRLAKHVTNYSKVSLAYGSDLSTYLGYNPTTNTTKIVYNLQGSGSHTITYNSGKNSDTYTLDGTAMPISINSNGTPLDTNTGYIVSSSRTTSGSANGSVRTASYRNGYLNNSISDTGKTPAQVHANNGTLMTYDRTKTEILTNKNKTYDTSKGGTDNFCLIKDDMDGYNANHTVTNSYLIGYTKNNTTVPGETGLNLKKYNTSRQALDTVLSSSQKVQGIHFMNASIAANNTETLPTVKINKSTYTNSSYPLLKNCIDFNTKETGIINFFGGTYYDHVVNNVNVTSADCFFSLYEVDRNETTHAINSVKLLSKIFKDNRYNNAYIYQYSDNTYSDSGTTTKSANVGDAVFDMKYLSETPPVQNALYYFEIPVNKGEFALGGVSGQDAGAYLLYLDISASQGDEQAPTYNQENLIKDASLFTQIGFLDSTSDFIINSCFNIAYVIPAGATKDNFAVTVSYGSATHEGNDYVCYIIEINNSTGATFTLNTLLMDDDDDPDSDYYYMYKIKYNNGAFTEHFISNTFTGGSGTTMTPTYTVEEGS